MKNIFNKTNAPYLAVGVLTTLTLLASGVFAVAPYIGFLAPVAALSVGLPFIIGGAIISAVAIALSAVVISKNNAISEKDAEVQAQEQRISEQKTLLAEKNTELFDKRKQLSKEGVNLNYLDLAVSSSQQEKQANNLDSLDLATSKNLNHLNVEVFSPANEPAKEETKVNGYLNQAVSAVNWIAGKATKAMPYLAASYLPYVFYNYATTPVSASFDDVNLTQSFVAIQA